MLRLKLIHVNKRGPRSHKSAPVPGLEKYILIELLIYRIAINKTRCVIVKRVKIMHDVITSCAQSIPNSGDVIFESPPIVVNGTIINPARWPLLCRRAPIGRDLQTKWTTVMCLFKALPREYLHSRLHGFTYIYNSVCTIYQWLWTFSKEKGFKEKFYTQISSKNVKVTGLYNVYL